MARYDKRKQRDLESIKNLIAAKEIDWKYRAGINRILHIENLELYQVDIGSFVEKNEIKELRIKGISYINSTPKKKYYLITMRMARGVKARYKIEEIDETDYRSFKGIYLQNEASEGEKTIENLSNLQ